MHLESDRSLCSLPQATLKNRKQNPSRIQKVKFLRCFYLGQGLSNSFDGVFLLYELAASLLFLVLLFYLTLSV